MKNGKCVKCQSTEVYTDTNQPSRGDRSRVAGPGGKLSSMLYINVYACTDCGYFEEYIRPDVLSDEKRMSKIKSGWSKVQ